MHVRRHTATYVHARMHTHTSVALLSTNGLRKSTTRLQSSHRDSGDYIDMGNVCTLLCTHIQHVCTQDNLYHIHHTIKLHSIKHLPTSSLRSKYTTLYDTWQKWPLQPHMYPYCNIHLLHYPLVSWANSLALLHVAMGLHNTCMYPREWRPLGACGAFNVIRTSSLGSVAELGQGPCSVHKSPESYRGGIQGVSMERLHGGGVC